MILLEDEELLRAIEEGYEVKDGVEMRVIYAYAIARAQLKKVVEWLDRPCHEHSGDVLHPHRRCGVCLQALKKEAGL